MFFLHTIKRGYNQSYLLAQSFSYQIGLPFFPLLKKTKYTKHQALLSKKDRQKNLINVFRINKKYKTIIQDATIYLIDDVISTGSTANSVAQTLKRSGAARVYGFFLATQK